MRCYLEHLNRQKSYLTESSCLELLTDFKGRDDAQLSYILHFNGVLRKVCNLHPSFSRETFGARMRFLTVETMMSRAFPL